MNKLSQIGLYLIKYFQGLKLKSYKCPAGVWTIGYGHTKNVLPGMIINQQKANQLLLEDLMTSINGVDKCIGKIKLTDNQYSALVSFAFNAGIGSLQISTLLKLIKANKIKQAANQFKKWNKIKKYKNGKPYYQPLKGLTLRRFAQQLIFNNQNISKDIFNKQVQKKRKSL